MPPGRLIVQITLSLAACTSLFVGTAKGQNQDQCRDVLQDGIRDQYSVTNQTNLKSSFKNGFCSSMNNSSSGSTGAGLGVNVPLADAILGVKGNFNQDQQQTMKNKYCGNASGDLSNDDYVAMMKRVASQQVVEAWSQCMHDRAPVPAQSGLVSEIQTAGGTDFVFKFRWIAAFNQNNPTVGDFFTSHATCSGTSINKGALIGTGWSVAQCTRQGNEAVMVTLEAANQLGATTQTLQALGTTTPVVNAPPAATDLKTKCMNGSATACSSSWQQTKDTCGFDAACIGRSQCWMNKSRAITLIKADA